VLLAARRAGGQVRFNANDIRKEVILLWTFSYRGGVSARAAMLGDLVFGVLDADHGEALPYNKSRLRRTGFPSVWPCCTCLDS
jgi:hypothetical protein